MMQVKLEEGMDRMAAAEAAYKGCAKPMLAGTLITAAGFIPVGLAQGQTAEYTSSFFWVIGSTLLISWLASIFVSPVLGYKFIRVKSKEERAKEKKKGIKEKIGEKSYQIFDRLIKGSIRYRKSVIVGTFALFAVTMMIGSFFVSGRRRSFATISSPSSSGSIMSKRARSGCFSSSFL